MRLAAGVGDVEAEDGVEVTLTDERGEVPVQLPFSGSMTVFRVTSQGRPRAPAGAAINARARADAGAAATFCRAGSAGRGTAFARITRTLPPTRPQSGPET